MANPILFSLVCLSSLLIVTGAASISKPQAAASFNVSLIQSVRNCPYTVIISTSCSSPRYTRDHISIAFGDSYGNQIYAPRLDDPSSKAFEHCSSDTFQINGPCAYQICYMYLYRTGPDGWVPENVKIYGSGTKAIKFNYNTFVPESIWYGFNYCNSASGSDRRAIGYGWFVFVVLGFFLTGKLV